MNRGLVPKTFLPIAVAVGLLSASFAHFATLRAAPEVTATPLVPETTRDGSKDFDFLYGSWKVRSRILRHLFVNSHDWSSCSSREIVTAFSNGNGNLEVGDIHCANGTVSGITPRFYNPITHQWSLYWATMDKGLTGPPQVGHFYSNGVGIFDTYYTYRGIATVARYRWSQKDGQPHFEQLYSKDNGKTWELNWVSDYTRE